MERIPDEAKHPTCRFCGYRGKKKKGGWVCSNATCIAARTPVDSYTFEGIARPFGTRVSESGRS